MVSLTSAYGIDEYIDEKKSKLTKIVEGRTNPEYALWIRINGATKSWIYSSISMSMNFLS